jgi:hypothetical protein
MKIEYKNLDKHFVTPKNYPPFYNEVRIPRKLKKCVKEFCGVNWSNLSNSQRLWYYLEKSNPNYKRFLIKKIVMLSQ